MLLGLSPDRRALLESARSIAVVGASADPERPSHDVFLFLRNRPGIDVAPINPKLDSLGGVRAYSTLAAYAADHGAPDIVNVFRKPSEALQVAREAIAIGAKSIWFQVGVINREAIGLADAAGLGVAFDCCIKVEYRRLDDDAARRRKSS